MNDRILMGHGSGGKLMFELITNTIGEILGSRSVQMDDSAILVPGSEKIAFTTDTYTITPLFFPGGDIGTLAVNGTVNDLAVMGATPLYLSCGLILEEGLEMALLKKVLLSIKKASDAAGVRVVTGDTKVVEKGSVDKLFVNTSGIGILEHPVPRKKLEVGDQIIINGTIGDHGISVMAQRSGLSFTRGLSSDCAPLHRLIAEVMREFPGSVKFMRDATRGGVASVMNEIIQKKPFGAVLYEERFPLKNEVKGVCEILGIDPLYAANEGKVIMIVNKEAAAGILPLMKKNRYGKKAAVIGEIIDQYPSMVFVETLVKGRRMLPLLIEDQLPRIC
ncbi:MAG: hydrogenase expression/formation protein HypE [Candidatus Aminicenantes bacterium]|nr:hydrogenase expression/formation protein HypE [Candidatus Aminicenantes bacterium]